MTDASTEIAKNEQLLARMKKHWGWYLCLGLLLIILGVVGAIYSYMTSLVIMMWLGAILIAAGIFQLFYSFFSPHHGGFWFNLILGLLSLAAGIFLIMQPHAAISALVLVIGIYILLAGILRIIFALQIRQEPTWWIILLTGIVAIFIAILIFMHWPEAAAWLLGLFISIEIFLAGINLFFLAIAAKTHSIKT